MADGVDTAVDHVQPTALQPVSDQVAREADPQELPTGNHAVLALRELRQASVDRPRMQFDAYAPYKCILDRHGAIVAAPGAPVGYVGDFSVTSGAAAGGGGGSASAAPARPAQQRPGRVQATPGDPLRVRAPDLSQEHRSLPLAEPARQPDHRVQLLHARPSLDALSKSDPNLIGRHLVLLPGVTQEREYPPRSGAEP